MRTSSIDELRGRRKWPNSRSGKILRKQTSSYQRS